MRQKVLIFFFAFFSLSILQANLLYDITDGKYEPEKINIPQSMNDGEHYTLQVDSQTIVKYSYKTGQAVDTLLSVSLVKNPIIDSFSGYILSPEETKILVYTLPEKRFRRSFTAHYYIYDIKYNEFDPLSARVPQEAPVFSPDDRYIAFGHKQNLFMKKVDFKTDIPITKDGKKGKIINGIADWLYEEEFGKTHFYTWSPDSKLLAFIKFDESEVNNYSFQSYLQQGESGYQLYPTLHSYKYPKTGEKNPRVKVCIYDDFNKTTRFIKLNEKESNYIPRIKWTNNPHQLAIFQLNRTQNILDMYLAHPRTGIAKLILREEDQYFIDYENIDFLRFRDDNKGFYAVSERDGYRHIYQHQMDGSISRQITKGEWDITAFYGVDESKDITYYQSAEKSPLHRAVYAVNSRGRKKALTLEKGTHQAYFSKNYQYFTHQASNNKTPDNWSINTISGKKIRDIKTNNKLKEKIEEFEIPNKEFFQFRTNENILLNGWLIKPVGFNPSKKYPVVMLQYSGPNSQTVLDKWSIGWEYYLATQGFVVASVDGRGTGARGSEFRKCTYRQLGVLETIDQVNAAHYLGSLDFIDNQRIAICGWSYGGYMAISAMSTGEKVFKAGISIAPVTDWRLYNTAYTERFMRTPEENFTGYNQSSMLLKANQLNGRLLIIHGTSDDNVHVQNTFLYTQKLVNAGKQFEMQLYTDKDHSISGKNTRRHLYTYMAEYLARTL